MEMKSNAKQVAQLLKKDANELVKAISSDLQEWGNATVDYARRNHPKWDFKSYNLDRAQKAEVDALTLRIYIDPSLVTNKGRNYGLFQHDGTPNGMIKGDPWLERAVEEKQSKLQRKIEKTIERVLG